MRTQDILRTMTRTRRAFPVPGNLWLLILTFAIASCRGGCQRTEDRAATVEGRLALFPVAARIVASLDAVRLRASPAAAKLSALAQQSDEDRRLLEAFS